MVVQAVQWPWMVGECHGCGWWAFSHFVSLCQHAQCRVCLPPSLLVFCDSEDCMFLRLYSYHQIITGNVETEPYCRRFGVRVHWFKFNLLQFRAELDLISAL